MALSPHYFSNTTWQKRVEDYLAGDGVDPFVHANHEAIARSLLDPQTGLRMVVNIPADALLGFLRADQYLNAYDEPVVGGTPRKPSETRKQVDAWLDLDDPRDYFFGAVSIGGTGVRFYGEYCLVLKSVGDDTRIFDRNSYDLTKSPFSDGDPASYVPMLRGEWKKDIVHMLTMKLLPELRDRQWLITLGSVSDAILHDEEFVEVHRKGRFGVAEIEEVRQSPEDEALHANILTRYEDGEAPSLEEMLWIARRNLVRQQLKKAGVPLRVVVSSGRGNRWK